MYMYDNESGNLFITKRYVESGLNVIPVKADGSKAAAIRFSAYSANGCRGTWLSSGSRLVDDHMQSGYCAVQRPATSKLSTSTWNVRPYFRRGRTWWEAGCCRGYPLSKRQRAEGMSITVAKRSKAGKNLRRMNKA